MKNEEKDTSWEERFDKEFPYTLVALNGNIDRTDKVKSFIRQEREALLKEIVEEATKSQAIAEERRKIIEEMIDLSDKIESQYPTEFNEWRAFKGFRNALRDKINHN